MDKRTTVYDLLEVALSKLAVVIRNGGWTKESLPYVLSWKERSNAILMICAQIKEVCQSFLGSGLNVEFLRGIVGAFSQTSLETSIIGSQLLSSRRKMHFIT